MIYINRPINVKKIKYVLCDFDRTISVSNSPTSWSIFSLSNKASMGFKEETVELFKKYRPIEVNHSLSVEEKKEQMLNWPNEQVLLFAKYGIDYETFKYICMHENRIILRNDFPSFVERMYSLNIPVYIISAGLYEPIKWKLYNQKALFPNVHIISNHIKREQGEITGISGQIITSMNKDEVLSISSDEQGILFGDLPSDKLMATNLDTINVGFINNEDEVSIFNKEFDITLTGKSSFTSVGKILIKK
jgi:2-hydroxy-3-keto-5-methylthiopentenyl-1-phosphate phosphatase